MNNNINIKSAIEQVDRAIEVTSAADCARSMEYAQIEREIAQLMVLASIAKSLDGLVKNGLMVERP